MNTRMSSIYSRRWVRKTAQYIKREAKALFIGISVAAGAYVFFTITKESWSHLSMDFWHLSIAAALLALPEIYVTLKLSQDPYIVQFAKAFRAGFLSIFAMPLGAAKWKQTSPGSTFIDQHCNDVRSNIYKLDQEIPYLEEFSTMG